MYACFCHSHTHTKDCFNSFSNDVHIKGVVETHEDTGFHPLHTNKLKMLYAYDSSLSLCTTSVGASTQALDDSYCTPAIHSSMSNNRIIVCARF